MSGYVYLATNQSMKDLVKIGMTTKSVEERMKELSGTGVPTPFICRFSREVGNPREVEGRLHKEFNYCSQGKEFFKVDWQAVKVALSLLPDNPHGESVEEIKQRSLKIRSSCDNPHGESVEEIKQRSLKIRSSSDNPHSESVEEVKQRSLKIHFSRFEQYHDALLHLAKTYIHEYIYDIKSVQKAQKIRDRMAKGGDLYAYNLKFKHGKDAMEEYIKFLKYESRIIQNPSASRKEEYIKFLKRESKWRRNDSAG